MRRGPSVNGHSRARKESTRAGRRTQEQSLGAKPKVFNEKDFKRFLERVSAHDAMKKKNHTMPDAMTAGLRPVPLLPLMNGGYCIKAQCTLSPTAVARVSWVNPCSPLHATSS